MLSIEKSYHAFNTWKKLSLGKRASVLLAIAAMLEQDKDRLARVMALEMGKPVREGRAEIEKCAWALKYFAQAAKTLLADEPRESDFNKSFIRYEPLGPILAIMPWNYPFWQFFRMAAPALMAGNSILLKHSLNMPICAKALESLFIDSLAPDNLVQNIMVSHDEIPPIISDSRIRAVTLTGSTKAGSILAELAGKNLKKIVLELGGSDPFIILADAHISKVVPYALKARCQNNGQSCIAAKRFIVHRSLIKNFIKYLDEGMKDLKMGDPLKEETDLGPLANSDQQKLLHGQVQDALSKGAELICGGFLGKESNFYPPTILTKINSSMRVYHEEVFGPVACVYAYDQENEIITLANATSFGLSASIWTNDEAKALALCKDLECGSVFINAIPRSDPRLPFGGIKDSGFGRELGREGLLEFVNIKVICTKALCA
jgi:succinate-semialdehyde dehydrogenase/glutarate-semialdehyde dehydrogenase